MKATDLDKDISCSVCDGSGDEPGNNLAFGGVCPRCDGTGTINRYRDGDDGVLVITEEFEDRGTHSVYTEQTIPIRDEDTGGFEGRFGTWQPSDVTTGPMADYKQDVKDMLQNKPLGAGVNADGKYSMPDEEPYNGAEFDETALPGGAWPTGADLSIDEIVAWMDARGDTYTASVYGKIKSELGL